MSEFVPAAPGTRAVIIGINPDLGGRRPTEGDIFCCEYPVVAWRVMGNYAVPVTVQDVSDSDHCYVVQPDGSLLSSHPYSEFLRLESLDVAKAVILASAQRSYDNPQSEKARGGRGAWLQQD